MRDEYQLCSRVVGAIVQPKAASCHPYKLVMGIWQALLSRFDSNQLNVQTDTPATAVEFVGLQSDRHSYPWHIRTPRGTIAAQQVLLATNGYTSSLLPAWLSGLITPVRGQMSALRLCQSISARLHHSYGFFSTQGQDYALSDYLMQRPLKKDSSQKASGGEFMFGGGRFLVPENHDVGVSDDSKIDEPIAEYLHSSLSQVLDLKQNPRDQGHQPHLQSVADWTGIMGFSADGMPWVGMVPGLSAFGLWICAGFTGSGMIQAPLCAELVADGIRAVNKADDKDQGFREWEQSVKAGGPGAMPAAFLISEDRIRRIQASL